MAAIRSVMATVGAGLGKVSMFGLVRPCLHHTPPALHAAWLSHLCGMCLTLRDEHGHPYRLATNFDGLLVSVLVAAQAPQLATTREAAPCALRGFRRASVVSAKAAGARLAAAVSLVLAAARLRDHVADRDGAYGRPLVARTVSHLSTRWAAAGADTATAVGFDTTVLTDAVARQPTLEAAARPGDSPLAVTEPTETAVAAAFGYTATLAGRPHNAAPLAAAGRAFGRLAHLLDAVEDLATDRAAGAWNPLLATGTGLAGARKLCAASHRRLRHAVAATDFADAELVRTLLVDEVGRAIRRTFHAAHHPEAFEPPDEPLNGPPEEPDGAEGDEPDKGGRHRAKSRRPLWWGLGATAFGCAAAAFTCGVWRPRCGDGHLGGGDGGSGCGVTCQPCGCDGCQCGGGSDPSGSVCTGCCGACDTDCDKCCDGCCDKTCDAACDGCCSGCGEGCNGCCSGCGEGCGGCGDDCCGGGSSCQCQC